MARGILLLDVDGPLNPYAARRERRPEGYQTFRLTAKGAWLTGRDARKRKGLRVWLHPGHGALLRDLAADTGLDLVWATTWQGEANRLVAPSIGVPELPVVEFGARDLDPERGWLPGGSWKWSAVAEFAGDRPLAWFDDELDEVAHRAARDRFLRARGDAPTLLCHVDPRRGLGADHVAAVRAWAAALPG
ncbi:hypothetical protein ACFV4N_11110 [Actinosynnema sp. NPDC059797]